MKVLATYLAKIELTPEPIMEVTSEATIVKVVVEVIVDVALTVVDTVVGAFVIWTVGPFSTVMIVSSV